MDDVIITTLLVSIITATILFIMYYGKEIFKLTTTKKQTPTDRPISKSTTGSKMYTRCKIIIDGITYDAYIQTNNNHENPAKNEVALPSDLSADWEEAEKHLYKMEQMYEKAGRGRLVGLVLVIKPLIERYTNGERTEELYQAIWEISA